MGNCWDLTEEALDAKSFLVKYVDFDPVEDKYIAISLNYRGKIKSKEANETVQKVKKAAKVSFVEWMPTGFKIGLNDAPPAKVEGDPMEDAENTCVMIGNNIAVNRVFSDRLSKKYDMMYSQRLTCTGTSVKVWKRVNSPKLVKILDSWRKTTLMSSLSKPLMRKMMKMANFKQAFNSQCKIVEHFLKEVSSSTFCFLTSFLKSQGEELFISLFLDFRSSWILLARPSFPIICIC